MRLALASTFAAAAFLLNPLAIGCSDDGDEFTFSDTEMRAALAGEWTLTAAGSTSTVRFEQAATSPTASRSPSSTSWLATAHACGTRTLIASANACIDVTEMPLRIVVLDGPLASSSIAGTLRVYGTSFMRGELELTASGATANAQISPAGEILEQSGDFALARK